MKKKIIALIFAVFMVIPCFAVNASAIISEQNDNKTICGISISEDYKTLYYNETKYHQFDSSMINVMYYTNYDEIRYDSDEIKYVDFNISESNAIITADITMKNSITITMSYLEETYLEEYNSLISTSSLYTVDFGYPEENKAELTPDQVFGEKVVVSEAELEDYIYFPVNAYATNNVFVVKKGFILSNYGVYYYVDYAENDITDADDFYMGDKENVTAWIISDAKATEVLDTGYKKFNSDALGFLTGDFTGRIGAVILVLIFGLIPVAVFIVFLILSLRAKTPVYKKMFRAIWIISCIEIAVFAITMVLLR